jgi:hypothetical protein
MRRFANFFGRMKALALEIPVLWHYLPTLIRFTGSLAQCRR